MLMETAAKVNGWMVANRRLVSIVSWTCFALVCADYARFIDLPTVLLVPFWGGVILNVLRWAVWEGMVKPRLAAKLAATEPKAAEPDLPA
jgi:hypothetical protein